MIHKHEMTKTAAKNVTSRAVMGGFVGGFSGRFQLCGGDVAGHAGLAGVPGDVGVGLTVGNVSFDAKIAVKSHFKMALF